MKLFQLLFISASMADHVLLTDHQPARAG